MKVVTVVGARPQFIKASVVSRALKGLGSVSEKLLHTGQHFDANMSDVFFSEMEIPRPAFNLEISGGSHGSMTGRMLEAIERVLMDEKPDSVLVYGDTNSTLAGALAAAKLHIPVAHVEAGLRSFNRRMPEEINRVLTDHMSARLFAPTEEAVRNLAHEGVKGDQVSLVGDVMYDVSLYYGKKSEGSSQVLKTLGIEAGRYILATIHRQENTDSAERLDAVLESFITLSTTYPVVWPLHPRTRVILEKLGWLKRLPEALKLIEPVGYLDMVMLEKKAALIATDSGGVQKEAFFYGVPCVTLRNETEWVELVESGWNRLAPPHKAANIIAAVESALGQKGRPCAPYGDGHAAEKIARALAQK